MKRIISYLLAAVMLISVLACGVTASADDASATIEVSDVDLQLSLIATQLSKLKQEDGWYYSVTDLDHDGNLEFVAARLHPQDRSTNLKVWEINEDRASLTECKLAKDEDESFPDIMTDVADTYHDVETDVWYYMFYDNLVVSESDVYTIKTAVSFKESVIDYEAFAVQHTQADNYGIGVSYTDANGIAISPDQYNAAGNNAFASAERSSTNFSWLTGKDVDSLSRLIDSYAVFSGAKEPTETFPVPRPALLQDGTPAAPAPSATPAAPNATPVPAQEVKYLSITKNPTNENRKVSDTALFVACANAYESLNWTLVAPSGGEYSVQNFRNVFPYASVSGEYSTTLAVGNVEADMNGWGAYCTFYYRGQTARTTTAYIYVKNEPIPESGSMSGYVYDIADSIIAVEVPGVDIFKIARSDCTISGEVYVGAPAVVYYNGRHARGVNVTGCTITGKQDTPEPDSGVYYGTVTDWGYSNVTLNLDGTSVALSWDIISLSGEIYIGAPATAYWNGTTTKGLNFTYCTIEGHQPDPDPVYGSMSGIAHEGGGGYAIDLQNGTQVFIDAWVCSLSGEFYDGAACIVYYTEPMSASTIYRVDIYGNAPSAPDVPETVYASISGRAFLDTPGTAVLFLDDGGTYYVDTGICNEIGPLVMAGGGNACVAYYYNELNAANIYSVDVYPAEENVG